MLAFGNDQLEKTLSVDIDDDGQVSPPLGLYPILDSNVFWCTLNMKMNVQMKMKSLQARTQSSFPFYVKRSFSTLYHLSVLMLLARASRRIFCFLHWIPHVLVFRAAQQASNSFLR